MESCRIASDHLSASFKAQGAELQRLTAGQGLEVLWEGNPSVWGRRSPILFPIVGALKGDRYRHGGEGHLMPKHGFARDFPFRLARLSRQSCLFTLQDGPATREAYPFPFMLKVSYTIHNHTLQARYAVQNTGGETMPFSLGAHPAFRWPLLPGRGREEHVLEFQKEEGATVRRLTPDGLLRAAPEASPLEGRRLRLADGLFRDDALIFENVASHAVRYSVPGGPVLELVWEGFSHLGVWSRPGAGFVCLEPWAGLADPEGWEGELRDKPGIHLLPPGETAAFGWNLKVHAHS